MTKTLRIDSKWFAGFSVIYEIKGQLLFYAKEKAPKWRAGDDIPYDEIMATKIYKQVPFSLDSIPSDAAIAF